MNYRVTTILLAAALLLVLGVSTIQAAPLDQPAASINPVAPAGDYDFTNHGTAWVPENRASFLAFIPRGWGSATRVKAAGSQWVHIPIPYPTLMAGSLMYIKYVEFCAKSSNGASTKPIQMDLWEAGGTKFYSGAVSWPADNAYHCVGHTFSPATWRQDLGISVLLSYANTTDVITLYKAWVRVAP